MHQAIRRGAVLLSMLATVAAVAGCTSGSSSPATSSPATSAAATTTRSSSTPATPVSTGPTRTARASSCPLVAQGYVHRTMGMRLARITVQRSGGKAVGCRFFALQGGSLHRTEHLPGPNQPAVEITTTRWPTATDAYNAFVLRSRQGTNATRASLGQHVGVCFQNDFYGKDHGQDWACATSVGATEVVVRSVDTTTQDNTIAVTEKVLGAVQA